MEILNSRVENVLEKQKSRSSAGEDTQLVSWTNEIQRTPYQQKHQDFGRAMIGTSHEKSDVSLYFYVFLSFRILSSLLYLLK